MVYLAESISDPTQKVAVKILKKTLKVKRHNSGRNLLLCNSTCTSIEPHLMFAKKEMEIHSKLDHKTIVKMIIFFKRLIGNSLRRARHGVRSCSSFCE